jgi:hypothetical protein
VRNSHENDDDTTLVHSMSVLFSTLQILLFLRSGSCFQEAGRRQSSSFPDPVILPIPKVANKKDRFANLTIIYPAGNTTAYLLETNYPWSVVIPSERRLEKTLTQAKAHGCRIAATNGGPYNADGGPSGPLVLQGQITNNSTTDFVGFGVTTSDQWILGNYHQLIDQAPSINITIWNFVTGFDWLVYKGQNVANNSQNPTGAHRSARTAIGVGQHPNNHLWMLVADGCEKW